MPDRERSSGTLALRRLLRGFEHFHDNFFEGDDRPYERLVRGGCGFSFGSGCSGGKEPANLFAPGRQAAAGE